MKKIIALIILMMFMCSASYAETVTLGSDADTYMRDGRGPFGSSTYMRVHGQYDFPGYVRYDLSSLGAIEITDATLTFVRCETYANYGQTTGRFTAFGMNNVEGNTAQDWDESVLTWANAGAEWTGAIPMIDSVANGRVVSLEPDDGADTVETLIPTADGSTPGTIVTLAGPDVVAFLQSRVFDGGLATIIIGNPADSRELGFGTKENTEGYIPSLEITYEPVKYAYLPSPADEAEVALEVSELSWSNPYSEGTVSCDVYFGTEEPNALLPDYGYAGGPAYTGVTELDLPVAIPVTPQPSTTYYWVVDCTDSVTGVRTQGKIWSFYVSGAPEIVADLAGAAEFEGTTAALATSFTTDAALVAGSPKWFVVGDPDTEVSGSDADVTISLTDDGGVYTSTLEIANLEAADEAEYYCVIENSNGPSQTSTAKLIVKRELAHFTFDEDPNDVLGNYTGVGVGSPAYEAGKVGNAIVFDGEEDYVTLSAGFEDFTAGLTITVWAYPTAANNWARFLDIASAAAGPDDILFSRQAGTNTLRLDYDPWPGAVDAVDALVLNEWQMFVVTLDAAGNAVIYKDGLPIQTGNVSAMPNVAVRSSNFIGASNWEGDSLYAGMMDDMHIFNYGLTADDVADMYAAVEGAFCRNKPAYDLTGDCIIDIYDLSYLSSLWLDCGFYPNPDCQ